MTTARIQLFQLTFQSADNAPESTPFASQAEAMRAETEAAAASLISTGSGESLREALNDHGIATLKPLDQIESLSDLTDGETVLLAEEVAGFRSSVESTWAEVDVYTLTDVLRSAGLAVCVFTVDDLDDRYDGDDPAGWLRDNRSRIEDTLSERGNEAIDDLLTGDGLLRSEIDDDDDAETTATAAGYSVVFDERDGLTHPYTTLSPEGDEVAWAVSEAEAWAGAVDHINGVEPDEP